jgi:signal transduction histidine kinase
MSQTTEQPSRNNQETDASQIRMENLLRLLLLFSLPVVVSAFVSGIESGSYTPQFIQLGFYLALLVGLLTGRRFSYAIRINLYVLPIVGFGFLGLVSYGLFGQGMIILVLACLMAALVNPVFYRNIVILCGVLVVVSGFLFITHILDLDFSANEFNASLASWLSAMSAIFITWLAMSSWTEMRRSLKVQNEEISSRENELTMILAAVEDGVIAVDSSMRVRYINPVACRLCECSLENSVGLPLNEVLNIHGGNNMQLSAHEIFRGTEGQGDFFLMNRSGISFRIRLSVRSTGEQPGSISYVLAFRNVTQEHRKEQQLRHAEKMETLGRITSGLVHDFNNHISVIRMSREMIEMQLERGKPVSDELNSIELACTGAHQLAMQLRSFVRQDDSPGVQEHRLHELVQQSQPLLKKAIPGIVQLELGLWSREDRVLIDRGQLQNALLNLVVNAADAIEERGTIVISTLNRRIEQGECSGSRFDIRPGLYIRLSVSDNGSGIPEDIRAHIFEPFFTTKGAGKGSGLGLASVVDLMILSEGQVSMESRLGQGTTFHLDFPLSEISAETQASLEQQQADAAAQAARASQKPAAQTGSLPADAHVTGD